MKDLTILLKSQILKILNPNGRKIDVDGIRYNRYIRQGYSISTDGSRLILPENVVPKVLKVGRKKESEDKTKKIKILNIHEKVKIMTLKE